MMISGCYLEIGISSIPVLISLALTSSVLGLANYLSVVDSFIGTPVILIVSLLSLIIVVLYWIRDSVRDYLVGTFPISYTALTLIFVSFVIFSEVMVFFGVFWSLYWYTFIPSVWSGMSWPLPGLCILDSYSIPMLGTGLLLSSAVFITWSHGSSSLYTAKLSLLFGILLGSLFILVQMQEYITCTYTISSSTYGSIFFVSTGLHGIHVLVGLILLSILLVRLLFSHSVIVEGPIWYWHFVDYVWLLLYLSVYIYSCL